MFHKKIKEQTGQLGQLGLIYVPVCPKNTGYVTANVLFCSQHNYSCIFLKGERERNRETERESGWEGAKERGRETETHFSQEYLNPQVWINKMVIGQSLPPKSFRVTHKNHCGPPRVLSQEYFVCWILSLLRQKMGGISNILLNRQHACLNYKQFKNF